ncbi:NAD(P)H-binding protein [Sphingobium phenoxybenzoativorans]|uniref:NAD(P)H-binding protein n=1 Tax=Sphingobium phenoxybenzoativorans TaxID=1592790 RepID=A0A975Q089_9SPHN|nr:NAD(P)H-binding protein [Sphingobium phenoxybenzoativorans]QUT04615.1 NAD(P)H-binding protein [Sphingobium phenoxybenzoativorans]
MKIGVSGASGQLGKVVIAELASRAGEASIVGISRTPDAVPSPAEPRSGDQDAPQSLVSAYAGLDRLILIPGPDLMPGVRARQIVAAIDAAIAADVGHIFLLSAAGTREKSEPAIGAAYWIAEQHLIRQARNKWTILRMNFFSETLVEEARMGLGMGMLAGLAENRVSYVSRNDVGAAIAGALTSEGHSGAIYNLTGPVALTGAERVEILAAAAGKPLAFMAMPEDMLRGGMESAGVPGFIIDAVVSMQHSFVDGAYDIVTGDIEKLSGKSPTPLAAAIAGAF